MTKRLHVRGIDATGYVGDGSRTLADDGTWKAPTAGASSLDDLTDVDLTTTPPTDGDTLVYAAASGLYVPGAPAAGGGGGGVILLEPSASVPAGTAVGTIVFRKAPTATVWSFAGISALPTGWSRRGVATETFDASGMSFSVGSGQGYAVAAPNAGADGTLEIEMLSGDRTGRMQGAILASSAALGAGAVWYNNPAALLCATVNNWAYSGSFSNAGGSYVFPVRVRLRKSGNNCYASSSIDSGTTWTAEVAIAQTFTLSTIGFGSIYGSAATMKVSYAKWTSVAASGSTGLQGWWDGSAIVPF